jgi:hypothetical protein
MHDVLTDDTCSLLISATCRHCSFHSCFMTLERNITSSTFQSADINMRLPMAGTPLLTLLDGCHSFLLYNLWTGLKSWHSTQMRPFTSLIAAMWGPSSNKALAVVQVNSERAANRGSSSALAGISIVVRSSDEPQKFSTISYPSIIADLGTLKRRREEQVHNVSWHKVRIFHRASSVPPGCAVMRHRTTSEVDDCMVGNTSYRGMDCCG